MSSDAAMQILSSSSIFNSAVVPFNDKFAGVFRGDNKKPDMDIHRGFRDDGIHWKLDGCSTEWHYGDPERSHFQYRYDSRVDWIEVRGYISWCNGFVYSFEAVLLDLEQPWKVIYRGAPYILSPQTYYECAGVVPNVAFAKVDEVIDFVKSNSEI